MLCNVGKPNNVSFANTPCLMNTNYYYFYTVKPIMSEFTIKYFTHYIVSCIAIVTIISLSDINSIIDQSSIFGGTQGVSYVLIFANLLSGERLSSSSEHKITTQFSCMRGLCDGSQKLVHFETRSCSTLKRLVHLSPLSFLVENDVYIFNRIKFRLLP